MFLSELCLSSVSIKSANELTEHFKLESLVSFTHYRDASGSRIEPKVFSSMSRIIQILLFECIQLAL